MRLTKLEPSQRVRGRWLAFLEDGSILRLGESQVVSFGLYAGMEVDGNLREELAAAGWLEELGYLNDEAYAKSLAEHYAAKGYGPAKVRDELYRRGVPREYWEEALEGLEDPAEDIDAFLRRKLKGDTEPKALKRAADALARRGYRWEDIKDGLRRYGTEIEEDGA